MNGGESTGTPSVIGYFANHVLFAQEIVITRNPNSWFVGSRLAKGALSSTLTPKKLNISARGTRIFKKRFFFRKLRLLSGGQTHDHEEK